MTLAPSTSSTTTPSDDSDVESGVQAGAHEDAEERPPVLESRLGFRLAFSAEWETDDADVADEWLDSFVSTDGAVRTRGFDRPNRSPFTGDGTTSPALPLREAADLLVSLHPDEFGPTPELTDVELGGRPSIRIDHDPQFCAACRTHLVAGNPSFALYYEFLSIGDQAHSIVSKVTWTSESAPASSNDHRLVPTGIEGLSVEVPSSWIPDPDRPSDHVGDDGFIKFATRGIEFTPAELAERSASHHLAPYGSAPTIESETMSGLAVAVVQPSDDGTELEGFTFGEIIVGTEPALSIVTDVGHLDAIRASLEAQVGATREGS